jgi:hypothetical protein
MHVALKRNTSVGVTGAVCANKSSVTGRVFSRNPTRGSRTVPPTIPITPLTSQSGWALGQSRTDERVIAAAFSNQYHSLRIGREFSRSPHNALTEGHGNSQCSAINRRTAADYTAWRQRKFLTRGQRAENTFYQSFGQIADTHSKVISGPVVHG